MSAVSTFAGATAALRNREFRIFWIAALTSNTGSWMQSAAMPYVVFQLTGRESGVGHNGFWQYIPIMVMGAVGGSLADRFDRRRMLIVTQLLQAGLAVALWFLVSQGLATPGRLAALAFAAGLGSGLNIPVWQAFVSQLVPRDLLVNAVTLNSTQFNSARALGTFLAGIIISFAGASIVFAINAASFLAVLIGLSMITSKGRPGTQGDRGSVLGEFVDGVRYVRTVPGIRAACIGIFSVALFASPLFNFVASVYGSKIFHLRGWRLGVVFGAGGIGSLLVAPLLLTVGQRVRRERLAVIGMLAYAVATSAVGLAPSWPLAVVGLLAFGGAYLVIASALNTSVQLLAREDMRGKAYSVYVMCLTGALPLGLLIWGEASQQFGIRSVTVAAGGVLVVVALILRFGGFLSALGDADRASPSRSD